MTTTDHTELLPAFLYESLPKPAPYPFDEPPSTTNPATANTTVESRPAHRYTVKTRIPFYPGVAYQAPTPGYPPTPLGAQEESAPPRAWDGPLQSTRHASPSEPTDPHTPRRTGTFAGWTGHDIHDALIHAATPPEPISLLNPTGEFARKVDAAARAREAEETIPKQHLPKHRLAVRLWRYLPVLTLIATCRHCGRAWPCHRLRRHLTDRHGDDIALPVLRLSTKRNRARAERRSPTAIAHGPKPRRIDKQEQQLGLR